MGLLDNLSEFVKTPEGQGLLSAAFTGMATANRGTPWNNLGKAGVGGIMGYSNALTRQDQMAENAIQNQVRQMQMGEIARKQEESRKRAEFIASLPPDQQQALQMGVSPDKLFERANPDPNKMNRKDELDYMSQLRKDEREFAAKLAANNRQPAQPYFQFIPTPQGIVTGDARTGRLALGDLNGSPVVKSADSPQLQGQIAGAKEAAKTEAEERTKATLDAPRVVDNAETALKNSDDLLKHPGFTQAVGKSSMLGIHKIPGTDGYDFMNRLDQLKGGAFLEAFNTLKGGGQITEVEGKKATDAISRMDNATSEGEFKAAVKDYQDVIRKGMNRARMKAKPVAPVQQPQQGGAKFLGFE